MIPIIFFAMVGGLATFLSWMPDGIVLALILAPFGASAAGLIAGLTMAARNPE